MIPRYRPRREFATRSLTDRELADLLTAARDRSHRNARRDHAALSLLAVLGILPSELLQIRRRHVALDIAPPTLSVPGLRGRRGELAVLRLSGALSRMLASYLEEHRRTFPYGRDRALLFPITDRQLRRAFTVYARRAGIRDAKLYSLRHTAAERMLRAGGDPHAVGEALGIDDRSVHRHRNAWLAGEAAALRTAGG